MEFEIEKYASVVGYTTENGAKGYYPLYYIDIDGDCIADEWRKYSLTPEVVAEAVMESEHEISAAISKILNRRLVRKCESHTGVSVRAQADLQRWNSRDYAVLVDEVTFDCAIALDEIDLRWLPSDGDDFEPEDGDRVFENAKTLGLVEWDGPYECYVDGTGYDKYLAARIRNEYGVELRGLDVDELSADQMLELKQHILTDDMAELGEDPSLDELADADDLVSDGRVYEEYGSCMFGSDDFLCTASTGNAA